MPRAEKPSIRSLTQATEGFNTTINNPFYRGESSVDNPECASFYFNILLNLVTLYQPEHMRKFEAWLVPMGINPKRFAYGQEKVRRDIPNEHGQIETKYVSTNKVNLNPEFTWARDYVMQFDHSTLNPEFTTDDPDKRDLARAMTEFAKEVWRGKGMPMKTENAIQQYVYGGEFIFYRNPDTNEVQVFNFFNYFPYPSLNVNDEARRAPYCACCRMVYLEEALAMYKKAFPDEITDDMTQDEVYDKIGGPRSETYHEAISNRLIPEKLMYDISNARIDQETREALSSMFPAFSSMFVGGYKNQPMIPIYEVYHLGTQEKAVFIDAKLVGIEKYQYDRLPFYTLAPVTDGLTPRGISPLENSIVYSRLKYNLLNLELDNLRKQNSSYILLDSSVFPDGLPETFDTHLVDIDGINQSLGNAVFQLAKPNISNAQQLQSMRLSFLDDEITAIGLNRSTIGMPTTNYNSAGEVQIMQTATSNAVAKVNSKLQRVLYPELLTDMVKFEIKHLTQTKSLVLKEQAGDSNILILPKSELKISDKDEEGETLDYWVYTLIQKGKDEDREERFYKNKAGSATLFAYLDAIVHDEKVEAKNQQLAQDTQNALAQLGNESGEVTIEDKSFQQKLDVEGAIGYLQEITKDYDKPKRSWTEFKHEVASRSYDTDYRIADIVGVQELDDDNFKFTMNMIQGTAAENFQKMQALQSIIPFTASDQILSNPISQAMIDTFLQLGLEMRLDDIVPRATIEQARLERKRQQEATIAAQSRQSAQLPQDAQAQGEMGALMAMLGGQAGNPADAMAQANPQSGMNANNQLMQQDPVAAQQRGLNDNNMALQAAAGA